jgi:hypothetical protein
MRRIITPSSITTVSKKLASKYRPLGRTPNSLPVLALPVMLAHEAHTSSAQARPKRAVRSTLGGSLLGTRIELEW